MRPNKLRELLSPTSPRCPPTSHHVAVRRGSHRAHGLYDYVEFVGEYGPLSDFFPRPRNLARAGTLQPFDAAQGRTRKPRGFLAQTGDRVRLPQHPVRDCRSAADVLWSACASCGAETPEDGGTTAGHPSVHPTWVMGGTNGVRPALRDNRRSPS